MSITRWTHSTKHFLSFAALSLVGDFIMRRHIIWAAVYQMLLLRLPFALWQTVSQNVPYTSIFCLATASLNGNYVSFNFLCYQQLNTSPLVRQIRTFYSLVIRQFDDIWYFIGQPSYLSWTFRTRFQISSPFASTRPQRSYLSSSVGVTNPMLFLVTPYASFDKWTTLCFESSALFPTVLSCVLPVVRCKSTARARWLRVSRL